MIRRYRAPAVNNHCGAATMSPATERLTWFDDFTGPHLGMTPCAPPCTCVERWWHAMCRLEQVLKDLGLKNATELAKGN